MYSNKCQRSSTIERNTEVESASSGPKKSADSKKGRSIISRIRCSKKTPKKFKKFGHEECRDQRTPICGRSKTLLEVTVKGKSTAA
jgi:hypothetical protein